MMKRFIMLAGPAMIGKSTAASQCMVFGHDIAVLHNDVLMHDMFKSCRLANHRDIDISDTARWTTLLMQTGTWSYTDIGWFHADRIAQCASRTVVADGYLYMLAWYRSCVYQGLVGPDIDFWLVRFDPLMARQVARRKSAYGGRGWVESDEFHERELRKQWTLFDPPGPTESLERHVWVENTDELVRLLNE